MTKPSARALQLQKARSNIAANVKRNIGGLSMAFAVICAGLGFDEAALFCFLIGMIPPCRSVFFTQQKKVVNALIQFVCESMAYARNQMSPHGQFSVDGAWNHRRNGSKCVVTFSDVKTNKIIHTEFISKSRPGCSGNYTGPSHNMESVGVKRGLKFLKKFTTIVSYVHDKDNCTSKIAREQWPELIEKLDPNHVTKSLKRKWESYGNGKSNLLYGLKDRLVCFSRYLLKQKEYSIDTRKQY